jgi:hypothetical protein
MSHSIPHDIDNGPHDIEQDLRELFDRQVDAMAVGTRVWDDIPMPTVVPLRPRRSRTALAAVISTAAAITLVVGVIAIRPGNRGVNVEGRPGSATPVRFTTPQVSFAADGLAIDAGGKTFTTNATAVEVHSDPGTPNTYTTLELDWTEHGVGMRLYIYFTSDGHNWWSNEIRTYNGNAQGDWIYYRGTFFRAPLGTAFTGTVDLVATEGTGHLRLTNLHLQPFLRPAACENATTQFVLDPQYDRIDIPKGSSGFGAGVTNVLNAASCTQVADPHAFSYDVRIVNPAVARIDVDADQPPRTEWLGIDPTHAIDIARTGPGTTMLHLVAHRKSDGQVIASADIPITVG